MSGHVLRCLHCRVLLGMCDEAGRITIERGHLTVATGWFSWLDLRCYSCGRIRPVEPGSGTYAPLSDPPVSTQRFARGAEAPLRCRRCDVLLSKIDHAKGLTAERQRLQVRIGWASQVGIGCYSCGGGLLVELAASREVKIYDSVTGKIDVK